LERQELKGFQMINRILGTAISKEETKEIANVSRDLLEEGESIKISDVFWCWIEWAKPRSKDEAAYMGYLFGFFLGAVAERANLCRKKE